MALCYWMQENNALIMLKDKECNNVEESKKHTEFSKEV